MTMLLWWGEGDSGKPAKKRMKHQRSVKRKTKKRDKTSSHAVEGEPARARLPMEYTSIWECACTSGILYGCRRMWE